MRGPGDTSSGPRGLISGLLRQFQGTGPCHARIAHGGVRLGILPTARRPHSGYSLPGTPHSENLYMTGIRQSPLLLAVLLAMGIGVSCRSAVGPGESFVWSSGLIYGRVATASGAPVTAVVHIDAYSALDCTGDVVGGGDATSQPNGQYRVIVTSGMQPMPMCVRGRAVTLGGTDTVSVVGVTLKMTNATPQDSVEMNFQMPIG